jgi:ribosome-binding factor A
MRKRSPSRGLTRLCRVRNLPSACGLICERVAAERGFILLSLTVYQCQERGVMPENRARKHHQDRVAETLRLEIGTMIDGELSDPRISNCYVSEVALNPGGKSARVYVAVDNAVKDIVQAEKDTIAGLEAAKGYIRYELKERMGVRHVPDLAFLADRSGRFQARIEELMDRSRKRNKFPVEPIAPASEQEALTSQILQADEKPSAN